MTTSEVLTRRPDGHETVHRFQAADEEAAKEAAVESGVPADEIVQATPELATQEPDRAPNQGDQAPVTNVAPEPESTRSRRSLTDLGLRHARHSVSFLVRGGDRAGELGVSAER
jgi:hypothetical protein